MTGRKSAHSWVHTGAVFAMAMMVLLGGVAGAPAQAQQDNDPAAAAASEAAEAAAAAENAAESAADTAAGALLSPEAYQSLQQTLADLQSRLSQAVDRAGAAVSDGEVSVDVPPVLSDQQVRDLLDSLSGVRGTLNNAVDAAGDLAVRAGEPQGTLVFTTNHLIGMAIGATGGVILMDLMGGGGIVTVTAATIGALGGYFLSDPQTWTWTRSATAPQP